MRTARARIIHAVLIASIRVRCQARMRTARTLCMGWLRSWPFGRRSWTRRRSVPRPYLGHTSAALRPYLGHISATLRLHFLISLRYVDDTSATRRRRLCCHPALTSALRSSQVAALSCGAPPDGAVAGTPSRLPPPSLNLSFTHTGGRSLPEGSLSGVDELETVPIAQVVPKEDVAISARYVPPKADVAAAAAAAAPAKAGWPLPWLPPRTLRRGTEAEVNASDALARVRLEAVRGAFKRAWGAYRKHAWGMDEIKPISNKSHDWLHLGATMIDCLDNLWIFGLKAEFDEAKEWVATKLSFSRAVGISMFETVIRIIGGLLSAFELSREAVFLRKAEELAGLMMYSFKANPETGVPCTTISLDGSRRCTFPTWTQRNAILAEFGTIQLEFKYLAHHTGRKEFWEVAERQIRNVRGRTQPAGLYPNFMSPKTLRWTTTKVSMGALADSFYEYLLKQWLLTQRTEPYLRTMFDEAMLGMARSMVARSTPSELVYIADYVREGKLVHKMDHLACFAGGMLAVGAQHGGEFDREYMTLAERIGETCYEFYRRTTSGLSPEFMSFVGGSDPKVPRNAAYNIGLSPHISPYFPISPHISPYLPISPQGAAQRRVQHRPARGRRDLLHHVVLHPRPKVARDGLGGLFELREAREDAVGLGGAEGRQQPGQARRQDGVVCAGRDDEIPVPALRLIVPHPARQVRLQHRGAPARHLRRLRLHLRRTAEEEMTRPRRPIGVAAGAASAPLPARSGGRVSGGGASCRGISLTSRGAAALARRAVVRRTAEAPQPPVPFCLYVVLAFSLPRPTGDGQSETC